MSLVKTYSVENQTVADVAGIFLKAIQEAGVSAEQITIAFPDLEPLRSIHLIKEKIANGAITYQILLSDADCDDAYSVWAEQWKPIDNPRKPEWDRDSFEIKLFDLLEEDLEAVGAAGAGLVWTMVHTDDGKTCVMPELHRVNRMGYFITEVPFDTNNCPADITLWTDEEKGYGWAASSISK